MRAMPFRVASEESVCFVAPQLHVGDHLIAAGEPAPTWDYLTPVTVIGAFSIDEAELRRSTGLENLNAISASIQVECVSTGFRRTALCAVTLGTERQAALSLDVPPHTLAHEIEVRYGLVLSEAGSARPDNMAAYRRGSRLHSSPKSFRFTLEGQGSGFPTEAFDFSRLGWPAGAAWHLNFSGDALEEPFLGAVRLFVNTGHPQAQNLLSGNGGLAQSVLFHGVLEHMLLAAADKWEGDSSTTYEEGTVGGVLDELSFAHLGTDLPAAVAAIRSDRADVLARLQQSTGFLDQAD